MTLSSSSRLSLSHLTLHSKRAASLQDPSHHSDDDQRQELKKKLALISSKLNASVIPNPSDVDSIMSTINELINLSPTKEAASSSLLDGSWILLWTGSYKQGTNSTPASLSNALGPGLAAFPLIQEASDATYSFFYKTFPLLAGSAVGVKGGSSSSLVQARGNYQIFDLGKQTVVNEARFEAFDTSCQIRVGGMIAPVQSSPNKISATFTNGRIDFGSVSIDVPIGIISPVGFVDTPYLDEDMRISIGDKGSVFIARKIKGPR